MYETIGNDSRISSRREELQRFTLAPIGGEMIEIFECIECIECASQRYSKHRSTITEIVDLAAGIVVDLANGTSINQCLYLRISLKASTNVRAIRNLNRFTCAEMMHDRESSLCVCVCA